jgi:hypothetical protein
LICPGWGMNDDFPTLVPPLAYPPNPALVALDSHSLAAVMHEPIDSSANVIDLFDDEVEEMDCWEDVVFLAASVIADVLGAVAGDEEERTVVLTLAAELFAARHALDPRERMH